MRIVSLRLSAPFVGLLFGIGLGECGQAARADDAPQSRPNIVFIMSDDHACQAISAYNDPRKLLDCRGVR